MDASLHLLTDQTLPLLPSDSPSFFPFFGLTLTLFPSDSPSFFPFSDMLLYEQGKSAGGSVAPPPKSTGAAAKKKTTLAVDMQASLNAMSPNYNRTMAIAGGRDGRLEGRLLLTTGSVRQFSAIELFPLNSPL